MKGLIYLKNFNIAHNDIKPDNLLIVNQVIDKDYKGFIIKRILKIADLGEAK